MKETELTGERGGGTDYPVSRAFLSRPRRAGVQVQAQGVAILVVGDDGAGLGVLGVARDMQQGLGGEPCSQLDRQTADRKKETHVRNKTQLGWATKKGLLHR